MLTGSNIMTPKAQAQHRETRSRHRSQVSSSRSPCRVSRVRELAPGFSSPDKSTCSKREDTGVCLDTGVNVSTRVDRHPGKPVLDALGSPLVAVALPYRSSCSLKTHPPAHPHASYRCGSSLSPSCSVGWLFCLYCGLAASSPPVLGGGVMLSFVVVVVVVVAVVSNWLVRR